MMNLPVSTWEEYCAICKADGIDPKDRQRGNFEQWMKERAALNDAINALEDIGEFINGALERLRNL